MRALWRRPSFTDRRAGNVKTYRYAGHQGGHVRVNRMLFVQIGVLAICLTAIVQLAENFPYPAPLIKPALPPRQRWPAEEIVAWTEAKNYEPGFLEFFLRDPDRAVPSGANFVSPSDGVIKDIVFENDTTYYIVGLSFWDVHVVRTPVAGVVKSVEEEGTLKLRPDSNETANQVFLKGKDSPVQEVVTIDSDYGEIKVRLITSYFARRLKVFVHPGDTLAKGARIGRILLGSSVVVDIPGKVPLLVQRSQRVVGGETVIWGGKI
jgi:phosphatidylserine decarboxylase